MTSFKCRFTKWFLFQRDGFQCAPWKFQQSVDNSTITHRVFCHIELKQSCFLMFFGGLCLKLYLEWITQRLIARLVLQVDWRVTLQILLPAFYIQESFRTCPSNWKSENMLNKNSPRFSITEFYMDSFPCCLQPPQLETVSAVKCASIVQEQ